MIVNVCTNGHVIHITDTTQGYNISVVDQLSFTDMKVRKGELNNVIHSILNVLEKDIQ